MLQRIPLAVTLMLALSVVALVLGIDPKNLPTPASAAHGDPGGNGFRPGVWISREEIASLPMEGPAWNQLQSAAGRFAGRPNLSDKDQDHNIVILAKALVWARTGNEDYRTDVRRACLQAIDTELGGRTLALGRELAAYVIAADIVGLEAPEDEVFRTWLRRTLTEDLSGRTLRSTHEDRPNNWGTHAGASRAAVAVYLEDRDELERAADVFRGWTGDRDSYARFSYGALDWQMDPRRPVGINPPGAVNKDGEDIAGALPEEMRRGGPCRFPPGFTGYAWGALQGATVLAEILSRQGYDTWEWSDRALLRAVQYLRRLDQRYPGTGWWAHGDDEWVVHLVNHAYGTQLPARRPAQPGKNMGWTDWTHGPGRSSRAPAP